MGEFKYLMVPHQVLHYTLLSESESSLSIAHVLSSAPPAAVGCLSSVVNLSVCRLLIFRLLSVICHICHLSCPLCVCCLSCVPSMCCLSCVICVSSVCCLSPVIFHLSGHHCKHSLSSSPCDSSPPSSRLRAHLRPHICVFVRGGFRKLVLSSIPRKVPGKHPPEFLLIDNSLYTYIIESHFCWIKNP